jgi:hypothetical protein
MIRITYKPHGESRTIAVSWGGPIPIPNPARELAMIGVNKRRDKIRTQMVKMRKDLGMPIPPEYQQYDKD